MARVRIGVRRIGPGEGSGLPPAPADARRGGAAAAPAAAGIEWIRFGEEVVYLGAEKAWPELAARAASAPAPAAADLRELPQIPEQANLHVVVQKGRLFQKEHPDVPVLVDQGRFLLVDIDAGRARKLGTDDVPCFSIHPLDSLSPPAGALVVPAADAGRIAFAIRPPAPARRAEPAVEALVARISQTSLAADLRLLTELPNRHSTGPHYPAACEFAERRFRELGYEVRREHVMVRGARSANVTARRAGRGGDGDAGAPPRGAVLVTAHLDSVNLDGDANARAPGADDDASGSAGVIAIAEALREHRGAHDLAFVLFGGEEQGLFGSKQFVAATSAAERGRVRAVVNMDMIARLNTPRRSVLLEGDRVSQSMIDGLAAAAEAHTGLAVQTSLNAANSDHVSFLRAGVPAVLTIEGADGTNEDIHTAADTFDRLDLELAVEILRMNTAFVAAALEGP